MYDEESLIRESVAAALPYAALENLQMQVVGFSRGKARPDAVGALRFDGGHSLDVAFEAGEFPTLSSIERKLEMLHSISSCEGMTPVLVAPYFSETKQKYLREHGLNYLDVAGNARLSTQDIFVDRSGKKPSPRKPLVSFDCFSDKATLVVRALFSGESLGVREMSSALGILGFPLSPGYISKTVAALAQGGYAVKEKGKVRLVSRKLLLEDWAETYRRKAQRALVEGWYIPEADTVSLARMVGAALGESGALTDRSGAHFVDAHVAFDAVDVLARDYAAAVRALGGLGAEPVERGANINLRKPVYPVSSFFGVRLIEGIPIVSDLQLYLDLQSQPKRGQEAAEHLLKSCIGPLLQGGAHG